MSNIVLSRDWGYWCSKEKCKFILTLVQYENRKVRFDTENIYIVTDSGHTIGNPLQWYQRFAMANNEEKHN